MAVALGDDSLVLAQRLGAWCSNGPSLEEDIALTNTALDLLGRARFFYQYANSLSPKKNGEDYFAYERDPDQFQNRFLYEYPNEDFAHTMVRQWLLDLFECSYFAELQKSSDKDLANIADKAIKECRYHLQRSELWVSILTSSTSEAKKRFNVAFRALYPHCQQLFLPTPAEEQLATTKIVPSVVPSVVPCRSSLADNYFTTVKQTAREMGFTIPRPTITPSSKKMMNQDTCVIEHGADFSAFIGELQELNRKVPNASW